MTCSSHELEIVHDPGKSLADELKEQGHCDTLGLSRSCRPCDEYAPKRIADNNRVFMRGYRNRPFPSRTGRFRLLFPKVTFRDDAPKDKTAQQHEEHEQPNVSEPGDLPGFHHAPRLRKAGIKHRNDFHNEHSPHHQQGGKATFPFLFRQLSPFHKPMPPIPFTIFLVTFLPISLLASLAASCCTAFIACCRISAVVPFLIAFRYSKLSFISLL